MNLFFQKIDADPRLLQAHCGTARSILFFLAAFFLLVPHSSVHAQTSPGGVLTSAACRLWIDAGDINADGNYTNNPALNSLVSTWDDKSGNGNDLTSAGAARPTYNNTPGFSAVRWDNTGANINFMTATTQVMLDPGTMYFVVQMLDASDGANCLFDRTGAGFSSVRYAQWNGQDVLGFTKYSTADYATAIASTYNANVIVSFIKTSGNDNLDVSLNATNTNLVVGSANPGLPLYVLGKNSNNDGMNAHLMESIVYNTNLNAAQKNIIDNYLSAKYGGIAIASDRYAGDTGGNGNYDFEMGGVGTEASGGNNQASASITGGLEVTQATAMGTGEYLMYAHPTGANSVNSSDVGGTTGGAVRRRWERIWYFDWTHVGGTTETVNLVFDFSDGGVGGSPAGATSNYKLLYRAGTSGNWTEVMNSTSIAGDRVTFNGLAYNTQGDGYYTIGTANFVVSPLPIELMAFNAEACENKVCLNWSTASEENTDHFLAERSEDGVNWNAVSTIDAAGNSNHKIDYEIVDQNPLPGVSYYRLSTFNLDKTREAGPIASVSRPQNGNFFQIYPNPAGDLVTVELQHSAMVPQSFELQSSDGRSFLIEPAHISGDKIIFNLSRLPKGIYLFVTNLPNGERLTKRFVLE